MNTALMIVLLSLAFLVLTLGEQMETASSHSPKNNWAVLVCSSRYWFNYRHFANTLSVYKLLRDRGYDDDHIILMSSMEPACDSRNPFPGEIIATRRANVDPLVNFYDENVKIDYRGPECSVDTFSRLLTGRTSSNTPIRRKMQLDENSNVLIYMTGHGGNEFFKFHDSQEISSQDMGYIFRDMHAKKRYKEIMLVIDTCQASTFANHIDAPNIYTLASSRLSENSFAYETNTELAVAVVDRFTYSMVEFFSKEKEYGNKRRKTKNNKKGTRVTTMQDFANSFDPRFLYSTATLQVSPGSVRNPRDIPLSDFFTSRTRTKKILENGGGKEETGTYTVLLDTTLESQDESEVGDLGFRKWVDHLPAKIKE